MVFANDFKFGQSRRRLRRTQECDRLDLSTTRARCPTIVRMGLVIGARRQMRGDRVKCLGLRTYRTSCINATDSICRRARMESQSVVKLGQWARVENAPKKAQLSKGRREARRSRPQGPALIESVALCVWQCHLRNVSTLSNRTTRRQMRGDRVSCPLRFDILSACTAYSSRRRPSPKKS